MRVHTSLGTRMKANYEEISKFRLTRRMPVIIRLDGKAFHTLTKGFQKPFDYVLKESMQETMQFLCENIQGCILGYTQSDEISLLLIDYKELNSSAWFDNEVQKMCSVSASMATFAFNRYFKINAERFHEEHDLEDDGTSEISIANNAYDVALRRGAMFDARCFNIPREEVTNYFYWRQQDAIRNSVQMVGQANFSHKELHKKSCKDIQDMLLEEKGIEWDKFSISEQRGSCCIKHFLVQDYSRCLTRSYCRWLPKIALTENSQVTSYWTIDTAIPIFKEEGRAYIEDLVNIDEFS